MTTKRITDALLQMQVDCLTTALNLPEKSWIDGKAQVGNIHLEYVNGRVGLLQHANEGGGCTRILHSTTKRELFGQIDGILIGIRLAREYVK